MSLEAALEAAILARLRADPAVAALVPAGAIHDGVPKGAPVPYVALDTHDAAARGADTVRLARHRLEVRIAVGDGGRRAAARLVAAVRAALDDAPLALASHRLVLCRVDAIETRPARDRGHAEGRVRVTALTEEDG